jgi:indole-3-glycerol phosphate synthase
MDILQEIAARTKERVEKQKKNILPEKIMEMAVSADDAVSASNASCFPFEKALRSDDIAFICEIKQASPSKGIIADNFPYLEIAKEYEDAGAAAISVLTEPYFFKGEDRYLWEIAGLVEAPLLRKDFIVDSYMIYEAKILGASAVLLICSLLDHNTLTEYIDIAHKLGLSVLTEAHDEEEVKIALSAGARSIGVNNRNLRTFEVDITLSERLRRSVPDDVLFISESGVDSPDDIARLRNIGADAVLIGESFMRSDDKKAELIRLRGY